MPEYNWPASEKRRVMGKRTSRVDGPEKASGRAKYSSDLNLKEQLFGVLLTSPHAHARVTSIDTGEAERSPGVTAVRVIAPAGTELQWAHAEIAAVAADTEEHARDAVRKIKVNYEVLPHLVQESDVKRAGARVRAAGEQLTGDPDKAFADAAAVSEGLYGIPVITHCCLETHGQVIEWRGDKIEYYPSTQGITPIGPDLAKALGVPATQIHAYQQHMGGGFGSKFVADRWGAECAQLSKASGGRPVKLFLDRATDQAIAGNRPSAFAQIKVAADKTGLITAWQSQSWATGGMGGGGSPPIPYVFTKIPAQRKQHSAVSVNAGPSRAWRAPNHPQASYLTCSAIEDLAAKLNMDPVQVFMANFDYTARPEVYKSQMQKAAELADWKKLWHPRGQGGNGPVKRGLGIGICSWGGGGHVSRCKTNINPDGTVVIEIGSQDLGTGTRTIIAMVAAETLGLPLEAVKVNLGDNSYPPSGGSGGSTTVGGVSTSTRKAAVNALDKLFQAVAPGLGVPPEQLEAVDGRIQVKGNPSKSLTWRSACQKLGVSPISEMGENDGKGGGGLNSSGVAGVQIADVSVDIETGLAKMNRFVAVQDMGLIINPKTAESQIFGSVIMGICSSLYEERVMDQQTGRMLNPDMEFYKLAGIGDIGEIIVHLDIAPEHDSRGPIGLGEPPAVGPNGAIANAIANAIGVRVPVLPATSDRILAALEGRNA